MSISHTEIHELESLLTDVGGGPQAVAQIHCRFPNMTVTRCDASDMSSEDPFLRFSGFDLFFVDGRSHCWSITGDPTSATGIVLANHKRNG